MLNTYIVLNTNKVLNTELVLSKSSLFIFSVLSAKKKETKLKVWETFGYDNDDSEVTAFTHYVDSHGEKAYSPKCVCGLNSCAYCNVTKKNKFLRKRENFVKLFKRKSALMLSVSNIPAESITKEHYQKLISNFKRLRDYLRVTYNNNVKKYGLVNDIRMNKGIYVVESVLHKKGEPRYSYERKTKKKTLLGVYPEDTFNVHLHALVDMQFISQSYIKKVWRRITGYDNAIVDIQRLSDNQGVSYLGKYLTKENYYDNDLVVRYESVTHNAVTKESKVQMLDDYGNLKDYPQVTIFLRSIKLMGSWGERKKGKDGKFVKIYEVDEPKNLSIPVVQDNGLKPVTLYQNSKGKPITKKEVWNQTHIDRMVYYVSPSNLEQEQEEESGSDTDMLLKNNNYGLLIDAYSEDYIEQRLQLGDWYFVNSNTIRELK